ncbi:MAG: hypothetical protein GX053_15415 [Tissierella sp.]|nr:hypothetical protein [Tissierella sp.]
MGTPYEVVFSKFVKNISDLDFISLDPDDLVETCTGYLDTACAEFMNCYQNLDDRDDNAQEFNINLLSIEAEILACIMTLNWLQPQIYKYQLIQVSLTDGDFRTHSPANQLKQLMDLHTKTEERYNRLMTQYSYKYAPTEVQNALGGYSDPSVISKFFRGGN